MAKGGRDIVVFDLGGVLIDWDPRHLYRKLFAGDEAGMEHFRATVCTHEWHRHHDAGRSFAEGARMLTAEHPDKGGVDRRVLRPTGRDDRWPDRWCGCGSAGFAPARRTTLRAQQLADGGFLVRSSAVRFSGLVPGHLDFRRGRGHQAGSTHLRATFRALRHRSGTRRVHRRCRSQCRRSATLGIHGIHFTGAAALPATTRSRRSPLLFCWCRRSRSCC
jgi:hypothetical protein